MADTAFQNARARRDVVALELDRLEQRVADLRKESKRIDEWLSSYAEFSAQSNADLVITSQISGIVSNVETKPIASRRNLPKDVIADFAYKLIEKEGRPVSRREIMAYLNEYDIHLEGKDPDMVLSTMLWRMPGRIVRFRKFGYWMADKDFPNAEYKANSEGSGDGHPSLDGESEEADNHSYLRSSNNPGMFTVSN